jgi:DNA-directed RNA polymerase specialized sigma24 family protein
MFHVSAGNHAALAQLFDGTSKYVYRVAARLVRDEAAAEEVTLDVYLQVWRKAESFDPRRGTVPRGSGFLLAAAPLIIYAPARHARPGKNRN